MSNYCEYKVGARITCKKTNDPNLNSDKCEINKKTRRSVGIFSNECRSCFF